MSKKNVGTNVGKNVGINKTEKAVLGILISNPDKTAEEMAIEVGVTRRTIERTLVSLNNQAVNVYDIDDRFREQFDIVIITIGALCWFENLNRFFEIVAKCMKPGAVIVLNEQHPCTNMLATEGDVEFDPEHKMECHFSYFEHEWTGNGGMYYMALKNYHSKTFTDYTHSLSEIISGMCNNGIVITGLKEYDHDISGGFSSIDHRGYPLSMILLGNKQ